MILYKKQGSLMMWETMYNNYNINWILI